MNVWAINPSVRRFSYSHIIGPSYVTVIPVSLGVSSEVSYPSGTSTSCFRYPGFQGVRDRFPYLGNNANTAV